MRTSLKFLIALFVGIFIFISVMKIVGWKRIPEAFIFFLSFKGLVILGISVLISMVGFLRWRFILRKMTGQFNFPGLLKIWLASFTVTYLTPVAFLGGEPFRAYFSKKKYALNWQKTAGAVIVDRFLDWTLFVIFTILGIFTFLFSNRIKYSQLILISGILVGALFFLLLIFYSKSLRKQSTLEWFLKLFRIKKEKFEKSQNGKLMFAIEKEIVDFFSFGKTAFWQGIGFSLLKYCLYFSRVAFLVLFLQKGAGLVQAFGIYGISNLALFIPVPATIGSMEATGMLGFSAFGFGMAPGAIFAMVLRASDLVLSLVGAVFLLKISIDFAGTKILEFLEKMGFFIIEEKDEE